MPTEEFYCLLRSALGFDHPSIHDERAPNLKIIAPYVLEEIDIICKKPRTIFVNGIPIVPQVIPNLNMEMNNNNNNKGFNFVSNVFMNENNMNENNGYWTNEQNGGKRRKTHRRRRQTRKRKNNRR